MKVYNYLFSEYRNAVKILDTIVEKDPTSYKWSTGLAVSGPKVFALIRNSGDPLQPFEVMVTVKLRDAEAEEYIHTIFKDPENPLNNE